MKILNRYIIKAHIGPFLFALSVIMFILLMQFMVKYIDKIFGFHVRLIWNRNGFLFYRIDRM